MAAQRRQYFGRDCPGLFAGRRHRRNGARFRAIVRNSFGNVLSNEATLTVTSNRAPAGTITQPAVGTLYNGGSVISFAGTATDPENGTLPASAFTWRVDFHHDTHSHPFVPSTSGVMSGSFTAARTGHTETNVWYRIFLTVRDSAGATHTTFRDVQPRKVNLTIATNPAGLQLRLDAQPVSTPRTFGSVVGVVRGLGAPATQVAGGRTYEFVSWSDGGAASHNITTPAGNRTYTANYRVATASGSATSTTSIAGELSAVDGAGAFGLPGRQRARLRRSRQRPDLWMEGRQHRADKRSQRVKLGRPALRHADAPAEGAGFGCHLGDRCAEWHLRSASRVRGRDLLRQCVPHHGGRRPDRERHPDHDDAMD